MRIHRLIALAALALAACDSGLGTDSKAAKAGEPRVVVADIDTTVNPYHAFYNATQGPLLKSPIYPAGAPPSAVTPEVLAAFGVDENHILTLTRTGKFTQDLKADEEQWKKVKRGQVYWYRGTNILAISFAGGAFQKVPLKPDPAKNAHGVGTSASVLRNNPEAILLFVETDGNLGNDDAHNFAFSHPEVDIVTTSYGAGIPFAPVGTGAFLPETSAFTATFDGVLKLGKLHFSSGGNSPGFTPGRAGAGPWWSIGVSGFNESNETYAEEDGEGRAARSGVFPDFVADFAVSVPYCTVCEVGYESVIGTSFSTPVAAGVTSKLLLQLRRTLGHAGGIRIDNGKAYMAAGAGRAITNWEIRRALEEAAWVPHLSDYDAANGPLNEGVPTVDAAPWLEYGWGVLSTDPAKSVLDDALAVLGFGTRKNTKAAGFCDFQTKVIEFRKGYWDNLALDAGERTLPGEDPFIFCGSGLPSP